MQKIVGIRFKSAGKIYYFDPLNIDLKISDNVIVETARGLEYGAVVLGVKEVEEETLKHPVKPVIRKATPSDDKRHENNLSKVDESVRLCNEEIKKHRLNMRIVRAEYTFDASKIIFYFTSDNRVDFRELVKDLAGIFRIRIELRQIGVRDEAKMLGGIGPCGCQLCCHRFIGEFHPVSIKMAKDQGLSLNPSKISGVCSRLLCCLQYEHECYEECLKELPEVGQLVSTPEGEATVLKLDVLRGKMLVRMVEDTTILKNYTKEEVKPSTHKKGCGNCSKTCGNHEVTLNADELKELRELTKDTASEMFENESGNENKRHNKPNHKKHNKNPRVNSEHKSDEHSNVKNTHSGHHNNHNNRNNAQNQSNFKHKKDGKPNHNNQQKHPASQKQNAPQNASSQQTGTQNQRSYRNKNHRSKDKTKQDVQ